MSCDAQLAEGGEKSSSWNIKQRRNTMNRLATLAMTAVGLAFVGIALRAGGISYAEQRSDSDNVSAAVDAISCRAVEFRHRQNAERVGSGTLRGLDQPEGQNAGDRKNKKACAPGG
jgi:hypothetical protein